MAAAQLTKDSEIVVTYTATLNEGATIGGAGNPNTVKLEYSNNPNQGGEGDTGKTPENKVTVFTFQLNIDKKDEKNQPLKGAGFTLYKYDADAEGEEADKWSLVGTEIKGEDLTSFTWEGLDAGRYKLVESTTPSGYNTMEDIEFTITATFSDEDPVSVDALNVAVTENPNLAEQPVMSTDRDSGTISSTVVNESGAQLPSTGGIGTTIFYVVGGVLVVRAVVLLIAKRRVARR
ncbi:MAG TPA: LPXTG cell wall anchor domain-containing protein [Candidatus Anaerotruncus excrementipullorum]|uniref:LPXTG cell wall anchor domain-containing protein n=1 Tax=Candidatus Anaerotruncus excrementipullorum TaxID=2838465 RepID=A0A9D1WQ85_9FIRM|nr:LPXTG cell wall anchor domain-containing protein [Candidatus Anaerotruncus excrementipullorum]